MYELGDGSSRAERSKVTSGIPLIIYPQTANCHSLLSKLMCFIV